MQAHTGSRDRQRAGSVETETASELVRCDEETSRGSQRVVWLPTRERVPARGSGRSELWWSHLAILHGSSGWERGFGWSSCSHASPAYLSSGFRRCLDSCEGVGGISGSNEFPPGAEGGDGRGLAFARIQASIRSVVGYMCSDPFAW